VQAWRVTHDIATTRLVIGEFGDTHPVADNIHEDGRAKNSPVEFVKR
jgi:flagellar motor protein MotB